MRLFVFTALISIVTGCGNPTSEEGAKSFRCDTNSEKLLEGVRLENNINNYTGDLKALFDKVEPEVYQSGSYYRETYMFNQFNEDTYDWCYYYSVEVDRSGVIQSIYDGAR